MSRAAGWALRARSGGAVLAAALAQAPELAAYGLIALAPLGAAFGPQAMALALLGAVVANVVACLLGGGRLVNGPRAALSLMTAGLAAGLLAPGRAGGPLASDQVLVLLAIGLVAASVLQIIFGLLRLGTIVKFTPQPVRTGLMSGIGMLMIGSALPLLAGHPFGAGLRDLATGSHSAAAVVGAAALAVNWIALRLRWRVPPVLAGLVAGALLQAALSAAGWGAGLSPLVGVPALPMPLLASLPASWPGSGELLSPAVGGLLGSFALTMAAICTLDTLLTTSVVDGALRRSRDANRELVAQGAANLLCGLAGGQGTSPSIVRSLALVVPAADSRYIGLVYAAALLALLLGVPGLMGRLPTSAVGGVLLLQGLLMVSPALWRTPVQMWGGHRLRQATGFDRGQRRLLIDNWGVSVAVALNTVVLGLAAAVLIGATFAVLLFVRANMRDVVRRVRYGENTKSLKMRPPAVAEALRREGRRIAVLELEGALFFGTADALRARLDSLVETVDTAILDLHQVAEIDATGARILLETGEDWLRRGKHLVAAEWGPTDPRRRSLEVMASPGSQPGLSFAADTDAALEQAEERLLDHLKLQPGPGHLLALADTLLGRGLGDADLAALAAEMSTVHIPAQAVLFRVNDPGDGLYVSVSGHIGLQLPGGTRRLASFAPGVVLGEMALLSGLPRSAQAVAETDLTVLRLSVEAFERLKRERPALAAQVLHNIALHLADRVRALTGELSGWVARSSVARPDNAAAAPPDRLKFAVRPDAADEL